MALKTHSTAAKTEDPLPPNHPAPLPEAGKTSTAVVDPGDVPSYLVDAAKADEGLGISTAAADNIVPLVYVMHPLSPQCDENSSQYIQGARGGSIWLRNCATPMVAGDQGILVQPVSFSKDWGEWIPRTRGGGMVGRHANRPATDEDVKRLGDKLVVGEDMPDCPGAIFAVNPKNRQKIWTIRRGDAPNDLIHTRNHAVRVFVDAKTALPYVIPLKSTGHGVSKEWMGKMMVKRAGGKLLPSFACLYRLTTRQRKNTDGVWWQFVVADAGYVSAEDYQIGKDLHEAFESGAKVAEVEVGDVGGDHGGGEGGTAAGSEEVPY